MVDYATDETFDYTDPLLKSPYAYKGESVKATPKPHGRNLLQQALSQTEELLMKSDDSKKDDAKGDEAKRQHDAD